MRPLECKLYVGNLAEDASKEEVVKAFSEYGTVVECILKKGYAFVVSLKFSSSIFKLHLNSKFAYFSFRDFLNVFGSGKNITFRVNG